MRQKYEIGVIILEIKDFPKVSDWASVNLEDGSHMIVDIKLSENGRKQILELCHRNINKKFDEIEKLTTKE